MAVAEEVGVAAEGCNLCGFGVRCRCNRLEKEGPGSRRVCTSRDSDPRTTEMFQRTNEAQSLSCVRCAQTMTGLFLTWALVVLAKESVTLSGKASYADYLLRTLLIDMTETADEEETVQEMHAGLEQERPGSCTLKASALTQTGVLPSAYR